MSAPSAVPVPSRGSLAGELAAALDASRFARLCGVDPDPWQRDVLRSRDRRVLMNASRQSGKSTTAAIIALHRAVYHPGSLVLLVSPSLRQSGELFRTVAGLHGRLETAHDERVNLHAMKFPNGSRVLSLPGSEQTIRGFAGVDLLILDEASRVSDDLYLSVLPMLATTNGRLLALSTPFGKRGWWSDAWHGDQEWKRVMVPATECPRISPAFLDEQRESMGEWWFRQEFLCEFVDAESSAFRTEDIERAQAEEVETWAI